MQETAAFIAELNTTLRSFIRIEKQFRDPSHTANPEDFQRQEASVLGHYEKSIKSVLNLLTSIERITGPAPVLAHAPTPDEARAKLLAFLTNKPALRPSPVHASSRGKKGTRPGHFICARFRGTFCLMVVLGLQGEVCTAYDIADVTRATTLAGRMWVPLPTAIPEKPSARLEFTQGSTVLALWNCTGRREDWTTEFFVATVVSRPCDRVGEDLRGYRLDFRDVAAVDGRKEIVVPEQFVVADSEGWLKAAV
jgi:hypothetical protein